MVDLTINYGKIEANIGNIDIKQVKNGSNRGDITVTIQIHTDDRKIFSYEQKEKLKEQIKNKLNENRGITALKLAILENNLTKQQQFNKIKEEACEVLEGTANDEEIMDLVQSSLTYFGKHTKIKREEIFRNHEEKMKRYEVEKGYKIAGWVELK